ncbi:hypothetical protein LNN94_16990 [Klebsiella pneumoniae subsp. pneumoniae]|nr:hypothetical protein [Klebsiella pneumoniae subsp. pneumoniae]MCS5947040.1 hypothetical protein [Klebsiella variicola subsp. variicola]
MGQFFCLRAGVHRKRG